MRAKSPFALLLLSLSLVLRPGFAVNDIDLPDMGSPNDSVLSKAIEEQIGMSIYRNLQSVDAIISDPEVQQYIQSIGLQLASHAQDEGETFQFFVINDRAINAFALPGGYIGVHSGLILTTKTESELAGVMAHEIAHVTQRHISRAVFANRNASIINMATLLGAILLGVATGVGGEAIGGAVMASQGLAIQQQIDFTRANEYEADRVGVSIMNDAGFDPQGMPDYFETMSRLSGMSTRNVPEFLMTHPVTTNRIAETRARAAQYTIKDLPSTTTYSLIKARLFYLTAKRPEIALQYFEARNDDPKTVGSLGVQYGEALSLMGMRRYAEAEKLMENLLISDEQIIMFHSGLAQAQIANGKILQGFRTFEVAMALFPRNVPLTVRYAEALLNTDQPKKAHTVLLELLNAVPPTSEQIRLIALAANAAGDVADSHYYMAEYHAYRGNLSMALMQLQLALDTPGLDPVQESRLRARLLKFESYLPEDQRRAREQQRSPKQQLERK
ncbi:MAG: M48 family metallopeptidase [Chromatiales bacterium]|jgi:beta-barrel assembly-enhancing protease|nr:M48 family metallopeptidase [Chromatiales bacterium]